MKTMLEACEPVFVAVSQLNRARMINPNVDAKRAAIDVRAALDRVKEAFSNLSGFSEFLPQDAHAPERDLRSVGVHRTLCHLVDDTATRFAGPLRDNWKTHVSAEAYSDGGWADLFFSHLETVLEAERESTVARRQVLLRCLELGFVGTKRDDPAFLKEMMERLRESLGAEAPGRAELKDRVGHEHPIEEKSMDPPPAVTVKRWSVTVAALVVLVIVAYIGAFWASKSALEDVLERAEKRWAASPSDDGGGDGPDDQSKARDDDSPKGGPKASDTRK